MKSDKTWISLEEAIEDVMRHKNCSRRTARRLLTEKIKDKKIGYRAMPAKPPVVDLSPAEVCRRLDAGEDADVLLRLDTFMNYFRITLAEAILELQAGRLVAQCDESTKLLMELGGPLEVKRFFVNYEVVQEWMRNPQTPRELIVRRMDKLQ